jgi:hypothetical protein
VTDFSTARHRTQALVYLPLSSYDSDLDEEARTNVKAKQNKVNNVELRRLGAINSGAMRLNPELMTVGHMFISQHKGERPRER